MIRRRGTKEEELGGGGLKRVRRRWTEKEELGGGGLRRKS